jgi:hypothetical protein
MYVKEGMTQGNLVRFGGGAIIWRVPILQRCTSSVSLQLISEHLDFIVAKIQIFQSDVAWIAHPPHPEVSFTLYTTDDLSHGVVPRRRRTPKTLLGCLSNAKKVDQSERFKNNSGCLSV